MVERVQKHLSKDTKDTLLPLCREKLDYQIKSKVLGVLGALPKWIRYKFISKSLVIVLVYDRCNLVGSHRFRKHCCDADFCSLLFHCLVAVSSDSDDRAITFGLSDRFKAVPLHIVEKVSLNEWEMLSHLVTVHDRHLDISENEADVTTTAGALQSFLEVANRVLTIIKTLCSDWVTLEHNFKRYQIERHIIY